MWLSSLKINVKWKSVKLCVTTHVLWSNIRVIAAYKCLRRSCHLSSLPPSRVCEHPKLSINKLQHKWQSQHYKLRIAIQFSAYCVLALNAPSYYIRFMSTNNFSTVERHTHSQSGWRISLSATPSSRRKCASWLRSNRKKNRRKQISCEVKWVCYFPALEENPKTLDSMSSSMQSESCVSV